MGIIGKVIGVLLLVLVGLFGGKGMTTKTVTSLQAPIAVTAGVWYQATGYVSADTAGIATGTHEILWYNEASADDGSTTPIGSEDIFDGAIPEFDPMVSVDTYAYSKIVQAPEGATEARGQATAIGTTGGGHNVDWGVLSLALANDKRSIVPGNVLPSHTNLGTSQLFNGFLEIPDVAGTFADGWTFTPGAPFVWDTSSPYQGTHSIRVDSSGSYHLYSPMFRYPFTPDLPLFVSFAYKESSGLGALITPEVRYLDAGGAVVGTVNGFAVDDGMGFSATGDGAWHAVDLYASGSGATSDTAFAQLDFTFNTTGIGSDHIWVDAFYVGSQSTVLRGRALEFFEETDGTIKSTRITNYLSAVANLDFNNISSGRSDEQTITVMGADVSDMVTAVPVGGGIEGGLVWNAYVSSGDTVTIRVSNISAGDVDPAAIDWRVSVWQH